MSAQGLGPWEGAGLHTRVMGQQTSGEGARPQSQDPANQPLANDVEHNTEEEGEGEEDDQFVCHLAPVQLGDQPVRDRHTGSDGCHL